MFIVLKEKLWAYIVNNNPDLMFRLQDEYGVVKYLEEKVSGVMPLALRLLEEGKEGMAIHELCMEDLTADLKPSRFNYLTTVISEEFETDYARLRESGMLTYEAVNLVEFCKDTFEQLHFSTANEDDREIRYAIIGKVAEYLEKGRSKKQVVDSKKH
ncbi:MAG: DUF1896 family protein [Candidatus Pseudobacter hemicellulosilyticus]|uniref:DUF1896 family protein n=1 Tax=Candidatus Pseudobacter hemicellulosilyticus TaxID=3121375 RepID=A0AAJ5WRR1_9BACT|nr:MAG: DUF1896 family protein [Pseudobacter sp.]